MAWFIKIDNKEDFSHMQRYVETWHLRCQEGTTYLEYKDMFARLHEAFQHPVEAAEVTVSKSVEKESPKAKKSVAVKKHIFCITHPTYQALRPPRTACETCWGAFAKYAGAARAKQARIKFDRKKTSGT